MEIGGYCASGSNSQIRRADSAVSNLLTFQKQTPVQSPLKIARLALSCARHCPLPPTLSATTTVCPAFLLPAPLCSPHCAPNPS